MAELLHHIFPRRFAGRRGGRKLFPAMCGTANAEVVALHHGFAQPAVLGVGIPRLGLLLGERRVGTTAVPQTKVGDLGVAAEVGDKPLLGVV